jgi:hypothetical protein
LHLLEQIAAFRYGHWARGKDTNRVLAVSRAIRLIKAILRDDEEQMILALDSLAFHLGYRIKKGIFDD